MNTLKSWAGKWRSIPVLVIVAGNSLFTAVTYAATPDAGVYDKQDLGNLLCNVIDFIFWLIIVIAVIMVLIAAFQYVTAGGDSEKTTTARRTLTYAAIGIAVALLAKGFPEIVSSIFSGLNGSVSLGSNCAPF